MLLSLTHGETDLNQSCYPSLTQKDTERTYPLWSVVDAEGNSTLGQDNWGVICDFIHGETRQLTRDFKHMKLGAGVGCAKMTDSNHNYIQLIPSSQWIHIKGHLEIMRLLQILCYSLMVHTVTLHTSYLVFPPTKALMCRSTGISFGGTMGTLTQPERFWALGWITWLSPSKIPSAKMSTARMIVSGEDKEHWGTSLMHSELQS